MNAPGLALRFHGVNRSGTEYACVQGWGIFDGPSDLASLGAMRSRGVDAVRVPLNEDCWLGINGTDPRFSGAAYQQAIEDYVSLANRNGLYGILDLHRSGPRSAPATIQQPMPDLDHSVTFWSQVASTFNGERCGGLRSLQRALARRSAGLRGGVDLLARRRYVPRVQFAAAGMQTLVDTVRATGATNVIALGGVSYSNALTRWLA